MNGALAAWARTAAVLLLAVAGCARFAPIPDPAHTVAADRYGTTQRIGDVAVTVRAVGWQSESLTRLEPYVTPLFVQIRNEGAAPVTFSLDDVVLVDNEGTLYRHVPAQRLQELLTSASPPAGNTTPVGAPTSPFPYDIELLSTLGALSSGPVPPGTQIRGAVYFQRIADSADGITLRLTLGGETREFRFRVR
jgi:hypothetical protein